MAISVRCVELMISSNTGILTVDLEAVQANWLYLKSKLGTQTECAAVVKADAYGVGVSAVSKALYEVGCRSFYLATLDEAMELKRYLSSDVTLYILGGVQAGFEDICVNNGLIPVLYDVPTIRRWISLCEKNESAYPCVIKVDTGMNRFGLDQVETQTLLALSTDSPLLNPVLLMSHLACADIVGHPLNRIQLDRFEHLCKQFKQVFPEIKTSLANSSGVFLSKSYHFDMVRVGAALYGINPQPVNANPLRQPITLKLPLLQVKQIGQAGTVGYNAEAKISANSRLAVVAGGYADGVHRTLGHKPVGYVNGVKVASVGRISMDSCIFDITESDVEFPEFIEVINSAITLDELVAANNSLGYEILTSLGHRYRRNYLSQGRSNE